MKGTIKTLNERGFGFITPDGGAKDIFFHTNSLVGVQFNDLRNGDIVTFQTEETEKGTNAINVERV